MGFILKSEWQRFLLFYPSSESCFLQKFYSVLIVQL